jgi:hypothetical protein
MKGKVLQHLLQEKYSVCLPGIGNFFREDLPAEIQPGAAQIQPPALVIGFNPKPVKSPVFLRDRITEVFSLSAESAAQLENTFINEIRENLASQRRFDLENFGSLLADAEGTIQFVPESQRFSGGDHFGLKPVKASQLFVRRDSVYKKEAPVIPLRPFDSVSGKGRKAYSIYAAASISLLLAAGSLFWFNSNPSTGGQQASVISLIQNEAVRSAPVAGIQPASSVAQPIEKSLAQTEASGSRFFVVAGSFKNSEVAEQAASEWTTKGYQTAKHLLEEKKMTRISIGSFDSKQQALDFLEQARPVFTASLWILAE